MFFLNFGGFCRLECSRGEVFFGGVGRCWVNFDFVGEFWELGGVEVLLGDGGKFDLIGKE